MVKWYIVSTECAICNLEEVSLFPTPAMDVINPSLECSGCGYLMEIPWDDVEEVPESFAKAEHDRLGLEWP